MNGRLSRRGFLQLVASLSTSTVLAACWGSDSPPADEETAINDAPVAEAISASIQTGWSANDGEFWPRAIEMFHEKPENVDMHVELINTHVTPDEFFSAIAGGDAPDIYHAYVPGFNALEIAPKGVVLPLDDFVAQSKYIDLDDYLPQQWDDKQWGGKTWALPVTEGGQYRHFHGTSSN